MSKPFLVDETSCPKRCCNKCDMYRKQVEHYKNALEKIKEELVKTKDKDIVEITDGDFLRGKVNAFVQAIEIVEKGGME